MYCLLLELWVRARLGRGIRAEVLGHRCGRGELDIEFTGFWVQKECALGVGDVRRNFRGSESKECWRKKEGALEPSE